MNKEGLSDTRTSPIISSILYTHERTEGVRQGARAGPGTGHSSGPGSATAPPRMALPAGRSQNMALGLTLPLCSIGILVSSSMGQPPWLVRPSPPAQFWTPRPQKSPRKPAQESQPR